MGRLFTLFSFAEYKLSFSRDRHVLKARINSRDILGDALELSYKKFKLHMDSQGEDLDQDIKARCRVQRS